MFDDFDFKVNCEELRGYDEESFEIWYKEDFSDYCDEVQERERSSYYSQNYKKYGEDGYENEEF